MKEKLLHYQGFKLNRGEKNVIPSIINNQNQQKILFFTWKNVLDEPILYFPNIFSSYEKKGSLMFLLLCFCFHFVYIWLIQNQLC